MGNQLDEDLYEAPQPTDGHTTAVMTDIVLAAMWDIDHTVKTNMVVCVLRSNYIGNVW